MNRVTKFVGQLVGIGTLFFLPLTSSASTITIPTQTFFTNQAWTTGNVYVVDGTLTISSTSTLTIEQGVIIKLKNTGNNIIVNGTLNANGIVTNPVYFTAYKDDTGGDTNIDGSATSPAPGQWTHIKTSTGATTTLTSTIIRYGGYASSQLYNNGGTLSLINSTSTLNTGPGIYHYTGTTTLTNTSVTSNSADGLRVAATVSGGQITVTGSTLSNNTGYGIYLRGTASASLTNNTFADNTTAAGYISYDNTFGAFTHSGNTATGNPINGLSVIGPIKSNQTWNADPYFPYVLGATLTINAGQTLTVDPGVIIKFSGAYGIYNNGVLNVSGTSAQKVYFTSIKDDIGNDTNNNGSATNPVAGDWDRLRFNTGATGTITNAIIRYGDVFNSGMVHNNGGTVSINDTELGYSYKKGILNTSGTLTASSTFLYDNEYGIYRTGGTVNVSDRNNIIGSSTLYGYYNTSTTATTSAENIYWLATTTGATSTGPYHAQLNPSGNGARVSSFIDFDPWMGRHFLLGVSSVDSGEIRYDWSTSPVYQSEWFASLNTWNALGSINIATDTLPTYEDLNVYEVDDPNSNWAGQHVYRPDSIYYPFGLDELKLNSHYLASYSSSYRQNVITHELGHALGLEHSFWGNALYFMTNSQIILGGQDTIDYHYLWN